MAGIVHDRERLRLMLGGDDLRRLRERLRTRFERGRGATGTLALRDPTPAEREAVDRLFGRRPTGGPSLRVDVHALELRLREARICDSLIAAIEALDGPIRDRRTERTELDRAWARVEERLDEACAARSDLRPWWDQARREGLLRRLSRGNPSRAAAIVDDLLGVIARLPAQGVALPELAAELTGNAHALDQGEPLGTLAARAAAVLGGVEEWRGAEEWRATWASVGVLCDEVSAPVLALNLGDARSTAPGLTDRVLALYRAEGEPCALTLRQLVRHPPGLHHLAGRDVYVCENPSVAVAVARELGTEAPPLLCIAGQLRASTRALIRRVVDAAGRLRVRADFDANGLHNVAALLRCPGAQPWRMSADDYLRSKGTPLGPTTLPETAWDPRLRSAMEERGEAVHEEQLLGDLIQDLQTAAQR